MQLAQWGHKQCLVSNIVCGVCGDGLRHYAHLWNPGMCVHLTKNKDITQGQNHYHVHPTTTNHIRIAPVIRIQCKKNGDIGTACGCHARLSKGGASGMDHDQGIMRISDP